MAEEKEDIVKGVAGTLNVAYLFLSTIKQLWHGYNSEALEEIGQIQYAYQTYCLPKEKENPLLSTLKERDQSLPLHFRMDKLKKVPLLFEQNFFPEKTLTHWLRLLSRNSITHFIKNILGYVCEYQTQRDARIWCKKGYNYDPTNLFFEEFKGWLIEISKVDIQTTPPLLSVMEGRITYLSYLINSNVFKSGNVSPTREVILLHIRTILEQQIKPTVELEQLRQSAREQFKTLKFTVQELIEQSITFLFYVFRNTSDTPTNFIIGQVSVPTLPSYQSAILGNRSGVLLHNLMTIPIMQFVCPPLKPINEPSQTDGLKSLTVTELTPHHFLPKREHIDYLLFSKKANFQFSYGYSDNLDQSGLHAEFENEDCAIKFFKMHRHLEELALFYLICNLIFELAGEGGNVLVYQQAQKGIQAIMDRYAKLIAAFKKNVNSLWESSERLQTSIVKKETKITESTTIWRENRQYTFAAYQKIEELIKINQAITGKINLKIVDMNTETYHLWIRQQTEFLSQLVEIFCEKPVLTHSNNEVSVSSLQSEPNLLSWGEKQDQLEKLSELYQIACEAYKNQDYDLAQHTASRLLAAPYKAIHQEFRNDLLVLHYQSCLKLNHFEFALVSMNKCLKYNPTDIQCWLNKTYLLMHLHAYHDAKNSVEEILKIDSTHEKALRKKGEIERYLSTSAPMRLK